MLTIVNQLNRALERAAMRSMFEARKRVFIDLLKWDLPALAGRFELDQFDDEHATYLIVTDSMGAHLASARLLPTTRPALLDTLYPDLVAGDVPHGAAILEITRFCLSPGIGALRRRAARNALLVGLVDYAQAHGIQAYTGVAELSWFRKIQSFGWDCRALGQMMIEAGRALVGLVIMIDASTAARLAAAGITSEAVAISAEAA